MMEASWSLADECLRRGRPTSAFSWQIGFAEHPARRLSQSFLVVLFRPDTVRRVRLASVQRRSYKVVAGLVEDQTSREPLR